MRFRIWQCDVPKDCRVQRCTRPNRRAVHQSKLTPAAIWNQMLSARGTPQFDMDNRRTIRLMRMASLPQWLTLLG
jgi:hypothetical protein